MKKLFIVVGVLLLVFATYEQAHWQREFAWYQASAQGDRMQNFAGMLRTGAGPFLEYDFTSLGGNINMVTVLFHKDYVDQSPVYTAVLGRGLGRSESPEDVRNIRRFARLEAEALEHARDFAAVMVMLEQQGYATGTGFDPGNLWRSIFRHSDALPTDDECHCTWQFTWVAETFPLAAALRQMIPVYIMAALLLAALGFAKKKHSKTQNDLLRGEAT